MVDQPPLLQYPTDYPIKVVGRPSDEFRARVHAIMLRHAPKLDTDRVTERLSDLTPAQLRKVRDYERRNANRKSVLSAIERALG